jgi:hypothetical protein
MSGFMRTLWAWTSLHLFVGFAALAFYACSSTQAVEGAMGCADPCCDGIATSIDCGEHPTLSCTEKGDPCTANQYGCNNGLFFLMPPANLPASCTASEAGADARVPGDVEIEAADAADTAVDALPDTATDSPVVDSGSLEPEPDGPSICAPDAASDACSCSGDAGATDGSCQIR